MESIRYQNIAEFSRGQVELAFQDGARVQWCGLSIGLGLTGAAIARQFAVSRDDINGYLRCRLTHRTEPLKGAEETNLENEDVCFLLPDVACRDSDYRLTGSVRFEKSALVFGMHCAGETVDVPILLLAAQPFQRETFRQHLSLHNASINSMIDIRDSRNCGFWIDFSRGRAPAKNACRTF